MTERRGARARGSRPSGPRWGMAGISLLLFFVPPFNDLPGMYGRELKHPEYEVKAAYIYNFGRFVQWPAKTASAATGPFTICVLGEDPFGPLLDSTIEGQTIDGKNMVVRRISAPLQTANCRILFISSSADHDLKEILAVLDKASVLTVSDMPQFARRGGMIQFALENKRVRFEVNLATAERAGLTLSSQLLKLAVTVRRDPLPGG